MHVETTSHDKETGVTAVPGGSVTSVVDTFQIPDPVVVRKLRWKIDRIILPLLVLMYTFNSLDRSNLGNAKTAGLAEDTNLKGGQYNLLLTLYYVMFVVFGPAMAVFTKVCTAKVSLPSMMLAFGLASACTAVVKNLGGLIAVRIFVGIFESGFLASVVFYLSLFYTRVEIASRIAIFYAGAVVASAFGGLLAYGMFQVTPSGGLFVWSYLFILEGCLTCLIAIVAYFVLPGDIEHAYFLTQAEKDAAQLRMELDSMRQRNDKFVWSEALAEFKTVHSCARLLVAFSVGILPNASANFLAIMTQRLGYSVTKTNLYTVAPACTAAVFLLVFAYSSDYFRERGLHMTVPLMCSIVGYSVLLVIDVEKNIGIGYMAIFFCTIGAYPMSVILSAWTVANIPNQNARALTTGVLFACINSMGLVASNIFFEREAPRYGTALIVNTAFPCAGVVFTVAYSMYLRVLNHRLDKTGRLSGEVDASGRPANFRFQA
ncbi:Fc.00g046350.m01.CDS01 [Cosmosporella sp. VM-42]